MKSYKEKQYLIFEFEDGRSVRYNLATGESIGKLGRPVKDVCAQLRGYSLLDVIDSFEDENYRRFLQYVDLGVNKSSGKHSYYNRRVDKIKNIGTFLKQINNYAIFEQYFASGITKVSKSIEYKLSDIPKGLLKIIREDNLNVTNKLIKSYKFNPDLFINIYNMEGLLTLSRSDLYKYAQCLYYFEDGVASNCMSSDRLYFIKLVTDYGYNPIKLIQYLDQLMTYEALISQDKTMTEIRDYAMMMSKISDRYDKYPRNFLTTHAIASRNYRRLNIKFDEDKFKDRYNSRLEFECGNFIVSIPQCTQDVREEAVSLNHCVASYIGRVINGTCHIVFLRHKEDPTKSLVTMELRRARVVQARGKFNRDTTVEENQVIKLYEKKLKKEYKRDEH